VPCLPTVPSVRAIRSTSVERPGTQSDTDSTDRITSHCYALRLVTPLNVATGSTVVFVRTSGGDRGVKKAAITLGILASVVGVGAGVVEIYDFVTRLTQPPASSASVTPSASASPSASATPVSLSSFAGNWRVSTSASAGDLLRLTIGVTSPNSAGVAGSLQGRNGVFELKEVPASFAQGTLRSESWSVGTSVDRYRIREARLEAGALVVEFEHCVVGQLGTTCEPPRTNTLIR